MTCIPIRDMKDTSSISQMCHAANEPITITKMYHVLTDNPMIFPVCGQPLLQRY